MDKFMQQLSIVAIERRPEACLGCGFEHGCSTHGCAVIKTASEQLRAYRSTNHTPEECAAAFKEVEQATKFLQSKTERAERIAKDLNVIYKQMQEITAELAAYKATGFTPDDFDKLCREMSKLRMSVGIGTYDGLYRAAELLELERKGKIVQLPFVAMVEQSMQGGKMKPKKDQQFNGRYAAVYSSPRWGCPLIDICGTPYNSEQALKRVSVLKKQEDKK